MPPAHNIRTVRSRMLGLLPWMGANAFRGPWVVYTSDPARAGNIDGQEVIFDPRIAHIPFAFTDGKIIAHRLEYLESCTLENAVLTAGHESLHYSLGHCERMHGKHPKLWNFAADDRVNRILRKLLSREAQNGQLQVDMPSTEWVFLEGPEWDADIKEDMTVEEVYLVLLRRHNQHQQKCPKCGQQHAKGSPGGSQGQPQPGQGNKPGQPQQGSQGGSGGSQQGQGSGSQMPAPPGAGKKGGGDKEWGKGAPQGCADPGIWEIEQHMLYDNDLVLSPEQDPSKREAEAYDKTVAFSRKIQEAVSKGNLPGHFAALVKVTPPKERWDDKVQHFVTNNYTKNDYSYARPQKQYMVNHGIIASTLNVRRPTILMVLDTSGSVPEDHIGQFLGVALSVCNAGNRVIIIECDTEVYGSNVKTLEPGEGDFNDPNIGKVTGRGGTYFRPPLAYAKKLLEEGEEIGGIMYFTDAGNFDTLQRNDYPDGIPVLWVITTDLNPNGYLEGDVVRFDPHEVKA